MSFRHLLSLVRRNKKKLFKDEKLSLNITYNKEHIFIGEGKIDRTSDILSWDENNGKINIVFKDEPDKPYTYNTKVKIEYPFFNKDIKQSHLYIGVKAGEKVSEKINRAKKSIKILSPFIGEKQIEQLIKKKKQKIDIHVISTDSNSDFQNPKKSSILKNIIEQEPHESKENKIKFNRLKIFINIYTVLYILSLISFIYLQLKGISFILFQYKYLIGLLILVIPIIYKYYKSIKVFYYEYNTVFPIIFLKEQFITKI